MFYAGWLLLGMVAVVLGVAMPNLLRRQSIKVQIDRHQRYAENIRFVSIASPKRQRICNRGALPLVHRSGVTSMSSRSDVVVLEARRSALVADQRAAANRRNLLVAIAVLALVVVAVLAVRGVIGALWVLLPVAIAGGLGYASYRESRAAAARLRQLDDRLEAARKRESESAAAILQRRLARQRERGQAQNQQLQARPEAVEVEALATEPVEIAGGWTPMPVPQPLYATMPREQRRTIDISQMEAQLKTRAQAREIYRPKRAQGIVNGLSTEEAAAPAAARLDVNRAIDRRRAANG